MSSSPSDSLPALPAEPRALTSPAAADGFEIRQRGWAKRLLPQTTFGRGLLPEAGPASGTTLEKQLSRALTRRVQRPFRIDDVGCERCVLVDVQLDAGVLSVNIPRGRLFTATTYIFILWMVGSSLVLLAIATVFLRNQVKSLRRLAAAEIGRASCRERGE